MQMEEHPAADSAPVKTTTFGDFSPGRRKRV